MPLHLMENFPEFFSNHIFLFGALFVVLALLIKAEFEHQSGKSNLISPVNAIRIMNNDNALVLDVRTEAEYAKGHIKNSKNIPLAALQSRLSELEKHKNQPVLAYCSSGTISGRACRILLKSGFNNVHNIGGGVHGWQDANLPLTSK
ncbi:MAG: rhodanese-like domain-containing protein [Gammaproteobacteria bacterium]